MPYFALNRLKNGIINRSFLPDIAWVGHIDPYNELYEYQVGPWATPM